MRPNIGYEKNEKRLPAHANVEDSFDAEASTLWLKNLLISICASAY
jgi:hypothetical protein